MANSWGSNPIILDTVNDDAAYTAANDVKNGGVKYSSLAFKVKKIQVVGGANTNAINLKQCSSSVLEGADIVNLTLETGDLQKQVDFPGGIWVNGIIPKTLGGTSKVLIHLY